MHCGQTESSGAGVCKKKQVDLRLKGAFKSIAASRVPLSDTDVDASFSPLSCKLSSLFKKKHNFRPSQSVSF